MATDVVHTMLIVSVILIKVCQWQQGRVVTWNLWNLWWHNAKEPSPDELTVWQHLLEGINNELL